MPTCDATSRSAARAEGRHEPCAAHHDRGPDSAPGRLPKPPMSAATNAGSIWSDSEYGLQVRDRGEQDPGERGQAAAEQPREPGHPVGLMPIRPAAVRVLGGTAKGEAERCEPEQREEASRRDERRRRTGPLPQRSTEPAIRRRPREQPSAPVRDPEPQTCATAATTRPKTATVPTVCAVGPCRASGRTKSRSTAAPSRAPEATPSGTATQGGEPASTIE